MYMRERSIPLSTINPSFLFLYHWCRKGISTNQLFPRQNSRRWLSVWRTSPHVYGTSIYIDKGLKRQYCLLLSVEEIVSWCHQRYLSENITGKSISHRKHQNLQLSHKQTKICFTIKSSKSQIFTRQNYI